MVERDSRDTLGLIARSTILDGRFRILHVLGVGGMGVVYAGEEVALKRPCALKFIFKADPLWRARFFQEARTGANLEHAGIVRVYSLEKLDGEIPFLNMELLQGHSLQDRLKEGRIDWVEACDLVAEATIPLEYAHKKGVIHRDLKPDNLFIANDGGRLKILDFGIAKVQSEVRLTQTGHILGTPGYMSREQVMAKQPLDLRSDVYSLGAVLYQAVTGELPYEYEPNLMALLVTIINEEPRHVLSFSPPPAIPPALASVIMRAIATDREKRFPSMAAFREALQACARDVPRHVGPTVQTARVVLGETAPPPREQTTQREMPPPVVVAPAVAAPRVTEVDQVQLDAEARANRMVPQLATVGRSLSDVREARSSRATIAIVAVAVVAGLGVAGWRLLGGPKPAVEVVPVAPVASSTPPAPSSRAVAPPKVVVPIKAAELQPAPKVPLPATPPKVAETLSVAQSDGAPSRGYLSIWSNPYALVTLDGRQVGETPKKKITLSPGSHVVELVSPTGEKRTRRIAIKSGQQATIRVDWTKPEEGSR